MPADFRCAAAALLAAALLAMSVGLAPSATADAGSTVTFGADLSKAANSTRSCRLGFVREDFYYQQWLMTRPYGFTFEQFLNWLAANGVVSNHPSCTWWNLGRLPAPGETAGKVGGSVVPFGGGVLTKIRIRTGPVVGRMQAVVLRYLRDPATPLSPGGPFYVGASAVFIPQPNAVTEVPVNIPVRHDIDRASGVWNYDIVALSVLDAGVPVPFAQEGTDPYASGGVAGKFPAWEPGVEQYPAATYGALDAAGTVLLQADVQQADPVPPVVPPSAAQVKLRPGAKLDKKGRVAQLSLANAAGVPVAGTVRLQRTRTGTSVSYGASRFTLAANAARNVRVTLSKSARRQVHKTGVLRSWARVTVGRSSRTFKVALR